MVDFKPDEEQEMIRESAAAFSREKIRPAAREADETGRIPDSLLQQAWEMGFIQGAVPEKYGGAGGPRSALTGVLVLEELGWGDLSIALRIMAPRLVTDPVLELGTEEQKSRILPRYTGARPVSGSAALMEPDFRFDPNDPATTATARDGGFVLTGEKCFVPLVPDTPWMVVYAKTEEGPRGFLVPREVSGLNVSGPEKNMGVRAFSTYEVGFDGCRIGEDGLLSVDPRGIFNRGRVALGALAVGVARAAFEYARDYAKERHAFGVAIARKQAIAFMLADMAIEIDAARLLVWEAAWRIDRGEDATREACLAKDYAAEMVLHVTDNALQILGGYGYIRDHPVEMWLRNGRGFAVFEGLALA